VEEAAAAATSLQDQAGKLSQVVGTFKLDGDEAPRVPAPIIPVQVRPAPQTAPRARPPVLRIAASTPRKPAALPAGGDWESL
jgi:hypothetical protein